jgi:hypothetical protein
MGVVCCVCGSCGVSDLSKVIDFQQTIAGCKAVGTAVKLHAVDSPLGSVAVCVLYDPDSEIESSAERVLRIRNPNVLYVFGTVRSTKLLQSYIIAEMKHTNLQSALATPELRSLSTRQRIGLMLDVARGIHCLHSRGIALG